VHACVFSCRACIYIIKLVCVGSVALATLQLASLLKRPAASCLSGLTVSRGSYGYANHANRILRRMTPQGGLVCTQSLTGYDDMDRHTHGLLTLTVRIWTFFCATHGPRGVMWHTELDEGVPLLSALHVGEVHLPALQHLLLLLFLTATTPTLELTWRQTDRQTDRLNIAIWLLPGTAGINGLVGLSPPYNLQYS